MSIFSENLKLLRKDQGITQQALADVLHTSRASLAKYELAKHEPPIDVLLRISRYFNISLDIFLTTELQKVDKHQSVTNFQNRGVVLPIQVNESNEDVVEIVPHSAQAGYASMYADPGYIESLDHMSLPFLHDNGKCRAFPVEGDSMPPFADGSYVIARYVTSPKDIKDGKRYIIVSRDAGIVFKRVYLDASLFRQLRLHSDNPIYSPYSMPLQDILEVWEFVAAITLEGVENNHFASTVLKTIETLQKDLTRLKMSFGSPVK